MDYRQAYIALLIAQIEEHMRQAWLLYQVLHHAETAPPPQEADDPNFPRVDLSFID
jgi:hypothetical protein